MCCTCVGTCVCLCVFTSEFVSENVKTYSVSCLCVWVVRSVPKHEKLCVCVCVCCVRVGVCLREPL